jgi:hypothetical protein
MNKLNYGFLAVGLIAVTSWALPPSLGPNLSTDVTIPAALAAPKPTTLAVGASVITPPSAPVQAYTMETMTDNTFRELNDAVAVRELLQPCVLFTQNVDDNLQAHELGAPVDPVAGETVASQHQARFPIFILAW